MPVLHPGTEGVVLFEPSSACFLELFDFGQYLVLPSQLRRLFHREQPALGRVLQLLQGSHLGAELLNFGLVLQLVWGDGRDLLQHLLPSHGLVSHGHELGSLLRLALAHRLVHLPLQRFNLVLTKKEKDFFLLLGNLTGLHLGGHLLLHDGLLLF